ncbi:unnamed protein product [Gongylonema pulchrum]|uniref:Uncharacterized protein n=1 Tax=Gongylonema pulchrum TaxID=637853 RepID=A0A183EYX2_9BILA|nr:unnamed protein product [Gongylonema pulchrum]
MGQTLLVPSIVRNEFVVICLDAEREKRARLHQQRRLAEAEGGGDENAAAGNWLQMRKVLDLEDIAFAQGSHLMSNKNGTSLSNFGKSGCPLWSFGAIETIEEFYRTDFVHGIDEFLGRIEVRNL